MKLTKSSPLLMLAIGLTAFSTLSTAYGSADGGSSGGGGDICDDRFKTVAMDITSWLQNSETDLDSLKLENGLTQVQYRSKMLGMIKEAKPSCTSDKVFIGKAEKTCRGFVDKNEIPRILCNTQKFLNETSETDQYSLVHHEYSGLSGVEVNNGEDSDYYVSNQITGYLANTVVKKLAIKPNQDEKVDLSWVKTGDFQTINDQTYFTGAWNGFLMANGRGCVRHVEVNDSTIIIEAKDGLNCGTAGTLSYYKCETSVNGPICKQTEYNYSSSYISVRAEDESRYKEVLTPLRDGNFIIEEKEDHTFVVPNIPDVWSPEKTIRNEFTPVVAPSKN